MAYVELHPLVWSFDTEFRASKDPYFAPGHVFVEPVGDYVGKSGPLLAPSGFIASAEPYLNPHPAHSFQWTLGDIVRDPYFGLPDLPPEEKEERSPYRYLESFGEEDARLFFGRGWEGAHALRGAEGVEV